MQDDLNISFILRAYLVTTLLLFYIQEYLIYPYSQIYPRCRLFKIWMKLVTITEELQDRESLHLCQLCETPLGFYLRVIVNEFHPNLEKTTSSALTVILINL